MKLVKPKLISSIKKFGGKYYQVSNIIPLLEYKPIFVEGFCGTGVISLNIDEKFARHICIDKDKDIINFWKVLQLYPQRLKMFLCNTEYSEENFETAKKYLNDNKDEIIEPFFHCAMYFIVNRMSRGADMKSFGWSDRIRKGKPEYISAYESAIHNLIVIYEKIKHIEFICDDYIDCMLDYGLYEREDVVQYLDPPYQHQVRTDNKSYGLYEMKTFCRETEPNETTHECLISFLKGSVAGVAYLSGYDSEEYSKWLRGYHSYEWEISNSASNSKIKPRMIERLWEIRNG